MQCQESAPLVGQTSTFVLGGASCASPLDRLMTLTLPTNARTSLVYECEHTHVSASVYPTTRTRRTVPRPPPATPTLLLPHATLIIFITRQSTLATRRYEPGELGFSERSGVAGLSTFSAVSCGTRCHFLVNLGGEDAAEGAEATTVPPEKADAEAKRLGARKQELTNNVSVYCSAVSDGPIGRALSCLSCLCCICIQWCDVRSGGRLRRPRTNTRPHPLRATTLSRKQDKSRHKTPAKFLNSCQVSLSRTFSRDCIAHPAYSPLNAKCLSVHTIVASALVRFSLLLFSFPVTPSGRPYGVFTSLPPPQLLPPGELPPPRTGEDDGVPGMGRLQTRHVLGNLRVSARWE